MSEEDLSTYKKYVSDLDVTKYIVLDSKSNYWYSAEYVDEMLKKQDKEIKRLNNIINELEKMLEQTIENSAVQPHIEMAEYTLKELKELKGSDKE